MNKTNKCIIVFLIFSLCFLALVGVVYYRIIIKGPVYKTLADTQYEYRVRSDDMNYMLTDCNGYDIMKYKTKYYVDTVPPDFMYNDTNSEEFMTLDLILKNYNEKYDVKKILKDSKGIPSSMEIDKESFDKLSKLKSLKGVYPYTVNSVDMDKAWSIENMMYSGIKSCEDNDNHQDSLENKLYNIIKSNKYNEKVFTKDINRNLVVENEISNKQNINIKLTIDKSLQDNINRIICDSKYMDFAQIGVVLMDDHGKIRAITQKDNSLPNINTSVLLYPGSIFKTIVEEAALEDNKISTEDKFTCGGVNEEESHMLHGNLNVAQAFRISCNDIFTQIGNKTGGDAIVNLASSEGILNKVIGISLEEKGILDRKPELSDGSLGLTAIGQNLRITPLEALSIPSIIVNQGKFIKPEIVEEVITNNKIGKLSSSNSKSLISKNTAKIIKNEMLDVVKNGTAKSAYTDKIQIGGKTGTTERIGDALGDFNKNTMHSDGWFAGFFKVNERYYSMVVCVQDIDIKTQSGGNTAAEIFKEIALRCSELINN